MLCTNTKCHQGQSVFGNKWKGQGNIFHGNWPQSMGAFRKKMTQLFMIEKNLSKGAPSGEMGKITTKQHFLKSKNIVLI